MSEPDTLSQLQEALQDRYQIQRELGRGGMATVYLATDVKHDREVAIKVLHPDLSASLGPERFDREIKFAAKLQHPNILGLFDSGVADGLLYYVMPFVYGESLRDMLDRDHQLPIELALHIAGEVADALGYAHSLGIIHRDIKPENIMISGGHALVADFGIARAFSEAGTNAKLTETGMAVGTPLYMSPEQAGGDPVGPTSDLYSLACVLYEMLAGTPPFTGPNARAILARHAMEQVPSIQVIRDTVPDEIEDAVMATLAKTPADRPQTALQFREMLGISFGQTAGWTAQRVAAARRSGSRTAARTAAYRGIPEPAGRRVLRLGLMIGLPVVALAAVAGWFFTRGGKGPAQAIGGLDPHRIAVLYLEDKSNDHRLGYAADGLTEALIGALQQVPSLSVVSKGGVAPYRDPAIPRDSIGRVLAAGILIQGSVEPVGEKLRVQLRLVDGNSGVDFPSRQKSFDAPTGEFLAVRDSLASEAALLIRDQLREEIRLRDQRAGTENANAWALLQRAELEHKKGDEAVNQSDSAGFDLAYRRADSLAAEAAALDDKWPDPIVLRGTLAYWRSRHASDPRAMGQWVDTGLEQAEKALALGAQNPDALELRGNLRYWRWLNSLEPDAQRARALLDGAQKDLERATTVNPNQAGAWATLSHLYNNAPGKGSTDVTIAAQRALEADAFLSNADVIVDRLFTANYDLGKVPESDRWCHEGARRFPHEARFVLCQMWLMTMQGEPADPAKAWALADSLKKLPPSSSREFDELYNNMVVAAILARAKLADSARSVIQRSKGNPTIDPTQELTLLAALAYTLLGDNGDAVAMLKSYLAASPTRRNAFKDDSGWWFRALDSDAEYRRLVGRTS